MFKKGDVVYLNELGMRNLKGSHGFNPCLDRLLNGEKDWIDYARAARSGVS